MNYQLSTYYDKVWVIDFEFRAPAGELPTVCCMVARELFSDETIRMSQAELNTAEVSPFDVSERTLFVAYYSSAEWGCFLSLGWPLPVRVLDVFVEFKNDLGGLEPKFSHSLLGALAQYGMEGIAPAEKSEMRQLAMQGGPYTTDEMEALLDYCQSDVDALKGLLERMLPSIDLPRALLRGRYMVAIARMERTGTPIDVSFLDKLREHRIGIQSTLIREVDQLYDVYDGTTFKYAKLEAWLIRSGIYGWPRLPSGRLKTDTDTFKEQAIIHPEVTQLAVLRGSMGKMKNEKLSYGRDGRNRCLLSPFSSVTGRNQPSNSKFIFGQPTWFRSLIQPSKALAYVDWSNQELGIAAALSGDLNLIAAYNSGDPYLAFAKLAKAVPEDATKASHPREREMYKACSLGVQYGMGENGLAARLQIPPAAARQLLERHQQAYPVFWKWTQSNIDLAALTGSVSSVFGWTYKVGNELKPRTVANFPCQANGAEMLRLACCIATEAGILVCCPVHDALLIEASAEEIEDEVVRVQGFMAEASRVVLGGLELRTDVDIVRHPDRYVDGRGQEMWSMVKNYLDQKVMEV